MKQDHQGKYGSGPGLRDPKDPIANSETAKVDQQAKVADTVGAGPSIRRPSNTSSNNSPKFEHHEHRNDTQSPPPHDNDLDQNGVSPPKSPEELHHNALSSIRTKIGLDSEAPILDEHHGHHHLTWSSVRVILREPFAEFFGVFIMILFGDGSVAQVLLSGGMKTAPGMNGFGSYQSISWG